MKLQQTTEDPRIKCRKSTLNSKNERQKPDNR